MELRFHATTDNLGEIRLSGIPGVNDLHLGKYYTNNGIIYFQSNIQGYNGLSLGRIFMPQAQSEAEARATDNSSVGSPYVNY